MAENMESVGWGIISECAANPLRAEHRMPRFAKSAKDATDCQKSKSPPFRTKRDEDGAPS